MAEINAKELVKLGQQRWVWSCKGSSCVTESTSSVCSGAASVHP